jgi:transposase
MIDMLKRHAVQVLREAGHSLEETAQFSGVSVRSVQRIEDEPPVTRLESEEERERRRVGRPAKAEPFRGFVTGLLREEPELLSVEVLRRARLKAYDGGKSALYGLVRVVRPAPIRPLVHFEGLPGEFTQHDFGEVDVRFLDGTKKRLHFFASRLKYSRWVEVSLVEDERVESLVRTMVSHFESMGGIPLLAVFDRPKTVPLKWKRSGDVTDWNPTFAAVAFELGLGIELCWPHSPEQKCAVENLVGWVKRSFFKQRRFLDYEDLLRQLREWLVEVNTQRPSRATREIPLARMEQERARLRPLRVRPAELALRVPVIPGVTGYVLHDDHLYSMDPEAIGVAGTLYLYQDRVRIVAGRHEALHPRLREPRAKSTLPQHRARSVAAVSGKRDKRYLQREHLLELGQVALDYLTELTHRRPRIWVRDVERLHRLLLTHGDEALRAALGRGLEEQAIGAEYIAHFLGEDRLTLPTRTPERPQELAL